MIIEFEIPDPEEVKMLRKQRDDLLKDLDKVIELRVELQKALYEQYVRGEMSTEELQHQTLDNQPDVTEEEIIETFERHIDLVCEKEIVRIFNVITKNKCCGSVDNLIPRHQ